MKLYNSQLIQKSKNVNILYYVRKKPRVSNCPIELEILTMNSLVTFFSRRVTLFLVSNFLEASETISHLIFSRGESCFSRLVSCPCLLSKLHTHLRGKERWKCFLLPPSVSGGVTILPAVVT